VTITAVEPARRTLNFETLPGYQAPSDFNTPRTPDGKLDFVRKYDVEVGDKQMFWMGMVGL